MSIEFGWGREIFALAMAIQNLLWGAFQPFAGAVSDRWGTGRVVGVGLFIAMGLSPAGLGVILGAVGRSVRPDQRSWAIGVGGAPH